MGRTDVEHPTFTLKRHPILHVLNTLLIREVYIFFYFTLGKTKKINQNVIHWTITLITPLFGVVHFKTNYNYRLSNHCFINELILVTYALISNAVEKIYTCWLYYLFINLHLFYLWWHLAHRPPVTLQFMALPSNWWFNSWFGLQIQQSSGVLSWQVFSSSVTA